MANLIFIGHKTRGKELHKLLERLGGIDAGYVQCSCVTGYYYINREGYIEGSTAIPLYMEMEKRVIMTLEEFERKYPYKVGDKVSKSVFDANAQCCYISNKIIKKETMQKEILTIDFTKDQKIADKVEVILGDYEFVLKDGKTYFIKKQPKYPKTYEECCKVMGIDSTIHHTIGTHFRYRDTIEHFIKLLICRDAYWKLAGEELSLGKPWEPSDSDYITGRYCIFVNRGNIICDTPAQDCILTFPTEEMRDTFYENFKETIKQCLILLKY